ncbi:MAG: hypothetical protein ACUVUD_04885 [bacterium]
METFLLAAVATAKSFLFTFFLHRLVTAENHTLIVATAGFGNGHFETAITTVKNIILFVTHIILLYN